MIILVVLFKPADQVAIKLIAIGTRLRVMPVRRYGKAELRLGRRVMLAREYVNSRQQANARRANYARCNEIPPAAHIGIALKVIVMDVVKLQNCLFGFKLMLTACYDIERRVPRNSDTDDTVFYITVCNIITYQIS
jgi:hypothetical protein